MQLPKLNFPNPFKFRISKNKDTYFIFDVIRNSEQKLTPEEWVRQHWIHYYLHEKNFTKSQFLIEKQINLNSTKKRIDLLILEKNEVEILVELKAPDVKLKEMHFEQIARYNSVVRANKIIISNGLQHIFAKFEDETYHFEKFEI